MQIRICDRCKESEKREVRLDLIIVNLEFSKQNVKELGFWFGRKDKLDLCLDCLEEFLKFTKKD